MDWNQISNYAARRTHTHKAGQGEARRPAGPRGPPRPWSSEPGAKCAARAPRRLRPPCPSPPPASSPARGWGQVSVPPPGPGLRSRTGGTARAGPPWPPPRKDFPTCGPAAAAALPAAAGPAHRRRPLPLGRSSPRFSAALRPRHLTVPPEPRALQGGRRAGCRTRAQTSSRPHGRKHADTDTCPVHTARGGTSTLPLSQGSPSPTAAICLLPVPRREGGRQQTNLASLAGRCGPGGALFPNLVPEPQ